MTRVEPAPLFDDHRDRGRYRRRFQYPHRHFGIIVPERSFFPCSLEPLGRRNFPETTP